MVPRVTLQTVADRLGVSRMTVSNAFSRPDQLSDELRQKMLATADELGYAGPDPSGRALARGRTGAVGVMLTDSLEYAFTDQLATDLMASITSELAPTGLALTLLTTASRDDFIPARDVPIDGAIVFSCAADSTAVEWLRRRKLPMVFVDQEPVDDVTCINIDERGGARAAAQHVVDLGHRRVAIVSSGDDPIGVAPAIDVEHGKYSQRNRLRGWLDALTASDITPTVVYAPHGREGGFDAAETLFDLPPDERPTAILCYSDTLAVGVLAAARRRGIADPSRALGGRVRRRPVREHDRPAAHHRPSGHRRQGLDRGVGADRGDRRRRRAPRSSRSRSCCRPNSSFATAPSAAPVTVA